VLGSAGALVANESTAGVVVTGAAGVGKTRLALELSRAAQSHGCVVEWVRATRSAASVPLGAFAPLLPAAGSGAELLAGARQALVERVGKAVDVRDDQARWYDGEEVTGVAAAAGGLAEPPVAPQARRVSAGVHVVFQLLD